MKDKAKENLKDLAVEVASHEGLKKQVDIAQITEILSIVGGILWRKPWLAIKLMMNGRKRNEESI